jgi:arabinofuranan 3-O-arabinosyltransferase
VKKPSRRPSNRTPRAGATNAKQRRPLPAPRGVEAQPSLVTVGPAGLPEAPPEREAEPAQPKKPRKGLLAKTLLAKAAPADAPQRPKPPPPPWLVALRKKVAWAWPPEPGGETPAQKRRRRWLHARPYVIVFAISSFIVSQWFRTGTFIATGDMGAFIRRGWAPEVNWSWNHQITGAGSAGYTMARGPEFILIWLCHAFGLTEYTAQWMFYTVIYGMVGFGVAYLAGAFVRSEAGIVAAGAFGVMNGFFLTRLPNPLNIISVGIVAFMTGIAMRVALGRRVPAPIAGFALIPTSFLGFNPPMLVVAYAWAVAGTPLVAAMILGRPAAVRLLWWFLKATPWVLILNVYWLVPLAQGYTGGGGATANATFTDPTNWSWSQVNNLPHNIVTMVANWAWFKPQYLPFAEELDKPYWVWVRYLLPALVFLAPGVAIRARRRVALSLLGLVVIFVVLAKGLRPPFSAFNMFLYTYVPGFWLFREPMSKLGQLLVSFFGVLLAIYVEGMLHRIRTRPLTRRPGWWQRGAYAAVFAPLVLALLGPYPLITGSVIPDERPTQPSAHVRVPQAWWDTAERIDADPRPGKVLVMPLDDYYQMPTTWGFFGVDSIANLLIEHPVVQRKPDGYFGDVPGFNSDVQGIETALVSGDLTPVPNLLAALGVSEVIIRHDLVRGLPNRYFADDRILSAAMERVPGLTKVGDGMLELWQVGDGSSPTVRTYNRVLDAPVRPDAGAATIGTVDPATAIAAPKDTAAPSMSPRVDDSVAFTDDVVHWPVPAIDSGEPTSTFELTEPGRFTVAQRSRAPAVLTPRVDYADQRLVLEDRSAVLVDGKVASTRPPLTLPLPDRPVIAVQAGTRSVSLDGWRGTGRTADAASRPTVAVGAATELTMYTTSAQPAEVTPFSDVYDCNNYEPRPRRELELDRQLEETDEGTVVRLSALDHGACTQVTVKDAKPGRTYRVRMEYRQVEGERPQICVWQLGTDGCELTSRPVNAQEWTPYERIVSIADGAEGMQVILHADVGERLKPRTVSEYRGLRIDALDPVKTETVWPPAVDPVSVDLAAGAHELRVTGGIAGTVLSPFEPLADCFRYDDQTPDEAGLTSRQDVGPDGDVTYTLGAVRHLACIAATAPEFGASSLYELSMEARSVAVRNPKFCVYLRGPDRCRTMPTVAVWDGWTPYEALFAPDPAAVETRIYLYGLRDIAEKQQSQVEYRQVKLRPVYTTSTVVLVREPEAALPPPAEVVWHKENPANFTVKVPDPQGSYLAFAENAAPGWQVMGEKGDAEPVTLQGWMNGWKIAGPVDATLVYTPSRVSRLCLYLLPIGVLASLLWMWHRRRCRITGVDRISIPAIRRWLMILYRRARRSTA